jgi:hypothetical protein
MFRWVRMGGKRSTKWGGGLGVRLEKLRSALLVFSPNHYSLGTVGQFPLTYYSLFRIFNRHLNKFLLVFVRVHPDDQRGEDGRIN